MGWVSEINNEQRRFTVGMFGAQVLGGLLRDAFLTISCSALQPWPQTFQSKAALFRGSTFVYFLVLGSSVNLFPREQH